MSDWAKPHQDGFIVEVFIDDRQWTELVSLASRKGARHPLDEMVAAQAVARMVHDKRLDLPYFVVGMVEELEEAGYKLESTRRAEHR